MNEPDRPHPARFHDHLPGGETPFPAGHTPPRNNRALLRRAAHSRALPTGTAAGRTTSLQAALRDADAIGRRP